jgi:hypothetical protein
MQLVKWDATSSEMIFGSIGNRKELGIAPVERKVTNIVAIAHTQDASEYIGISFNTITPDFTTIVTDIPIDTYYFFFSPIDGNWLTLDLVSLALKKMRQVELDKLIVTINEFDIDANEDAQNRMARAFSVMSDTDSIQWKGYNNTFVTLTKADLKDALLLAGQAQTALWLKYSL